MTGSMAQSYFIFDSVNYSIGRKIYYAVENNEAQEGSEEDELAGLINKEKSSMEGSVTNAIDIEGSVTDDNS